jgi:tetratricopeptide (TPR) repeat protein
MSPRSGSDKVRAAEYFRAGLNRFQIGQLPLAEALCRQALAAQPDYVDALHLLGVIAHRTGRLSLTVELIRLAIQQDGQNAAYFRNLGAALRDQGKLDEAVAAHRQAISINPELAEAHSDLGIALRDQGKLDEAVAALREAIRIRPDDAEAFSNLGAALRDQGKLDDAVAALREAIRIKPSLAVLHFNLSIGLRDQGKLDEAVAALREAIRIKPDYAEAFSNLGAGLRDQDKLDEAVAALREAIRIKPNFAVLHFNLSAALRDQGRLDDAAAALREAIRIKPDYAEAHCYLGLILKQLGRLSEGRAALQDAARLSPNNVKYRRYLGEMLPCAPGDPHLAALERLAGESALLSVDDRIELHFALGKAYEDAGWHEKAFRQWLDGNALRRRQLSYDESATLGALVHAQSEFTAELFRGSQFKGHPSSLPVFIVGMPRSGSTLVEQILASHPQVFGGGELRYFQIIVGELQTIFHDSNHLLAQTSRTTGNDLSEFGARYVAAIEHLAPTALHITDKMLDNFAFAGLIHLVLPNAPIIHTIRDPVDTCVSCFSQLFTVGQNYAYDLVELGRYFRHYKDLMTHWRRVLPPGRILDVDYEDVVADLEGAARRIVAHCGLAWDPRCLDFHRTERAVRTASAVQVRQPLYKSSVERWRKYEAFLGPLLAELEPILPPGYGDAPARVAFGPVENLS